MPPSLTGTPLPRSEQCCPSYGRTARSPLLARRSQSPECPMCHGMLWNSPYLRLTLLHQALVTQSCLTWQPSPTSLGIHGLCSWRPQRRIECSKWRCWLHDVKRITASCRNDIMISYKNSPPVGNTTTFQLFIGRLPTVLSAVFVQPCALPEPFRRLSLFPWIKAVF